MSDKYSVWLRLSECSTGAKSVIYDCLALTYVFREERSLDNVALSSLVLVPVLGYFRSRARVAAAVGTRGQVGVHSAR